VSILIPTTIPARSRGFAFVEIADAAQADRGIPSLNGRKLDRAC
jgi:RNA recognition motif. (a.k.a. RRM, RBD, or RNP domain)